MSKFSRRMTVSVLALASVTALAPAASAQTVDRVPDPKPGGWQEVNPEMSVLSPYGNKDIICNRIVGEAYRSMYQTCYQKRADGKWQTLTEIESPIGTPGATFSFSFYPVWEDPTSLNAVLPIKVF